MWAHIVTVGTYNPGSDDISLKTFINGQHIAQLDGTVEDEVVDNNGFFTIGSFWRGGGVAFQRFLSWNTGQGWIDDLAMFNFSFTDGEAIASHSLGNDAELNYDMSQVIQLLDVHRSGTGIAYVGGLSWSHATGLAGTDGQLTGSGGNFTLVLDAGAGTGLATTVGQLPDSDSDGVPDGCDICPGFDDTLDDDNDGVPDGCDPCAGGAASGDTDANRKVDLDDYADFEACLLGPDARNGTGCECFDFDDDGDNDLLDFAALQVSFTGS